MVGKGFIYLIVGIIVVIALIAVVNFARATYKFVVRKLGERKEKKVSKQSGKSR